MKLTYDLINKQNIKLATSIQGTVFPGESALTHYEYSIKTNYKNCSYYIVKWNNIPVGITGIYTMNMYKDNIENDDSIWLGWYGILPEFRNKGIGKQTLLDTIERAKKYQKKYFRLYTNYIEETPAISLYKNIMHTFEIYTNENDYVYDGICAVFSYSFSTNKPKLWNNSYAFLKEDVEMEEQANKKTNNNYKIFIKSSNEQNKFIKIEKLATSFREDGHLVIVGNNIQNKEDYDIIINKNPLFSIKEQNEESLINEFKNKIYQKYKK